MTEADHVTTDRAGASVFVPNLCLLAEYQQRTDRIPAEYWQSTVPAGPSWPSQRRAWRAPKYNIIIQKEALGDSGGLLDAGWFEACFGWVAGARTVAYSATWAPLGGFVYRFGQHWILKEFYK